MPHLTLEYSANCGTGAGFQSLFVNLHELVAGIAKTDIYNCKGRALARGVFCVADGKHERGFVHLEVRVLAGRTPAVKKQLGEALLGKLRKFFSGQTPEDVQFSVEILDIDPNVYFKFPVLKSEPPAGSRLA